MHATRTDWCPVINFEIPKYCVDTVWLGPGEIQCRRTVAWGWIHNVPMRSKRKWADAVQVEKGGNGNQGWSWVRGTSKGLKEGDGRLRTVKTPIDQCQCINVSLMSVSVCDRMKEVNQRTVGCEMKWRRRRWQRRWRWSSSSTWDEGRWNRIGQPRVGGWNRTMIVKLVCACQDELFHSPMCWVLLASEIMFLATRVDLRSTTPNPLGPCCALGNSANVFRTPGCVPRTDDNSTSVSQGEDGDADQVQGSIITNKSQLTKSDNVGRVLIQLKYYIRLAVTERVTSTLLNALLVLRRLMNSKSRALFIHITGQYVT